MEVTSGIFNATASIYKNNKGSILRTIVYTIGHFLIAISVLMLVAIIFLYQEFGTTDIPSILNLNFIIYCVCLIVLFKKFS